MRQFRQGGKRLDIILRPLRSVPHRQFLIQEKFRRLFAVAGQGVGRDGIERRLRLFNSEEIPPDQARIGGVREDLPVRHRFQFHGIETAVLLAQAQDGNVDLVTHRKQQNVRALRVEKLLWQFIVPVRFQGSPPRGWSP